MTPKGVEDVRLATWKALFTAWRGLGGAQWYEGNEVQAVNGRGSGEAILALIRNSRWSVDIETYIYDHSIFAKTVTMELEAAKQRGVRVRVVTDAIGTGKKTCARRLGGSHRVFNPPTWWISRRWITHRGANLPWFVRSHRKLTIADGETALIGSCNISGHGIPQSLGGVERYEELGVLITGPVVVALQETFEDQWNDAAGDDFHDIREETGAGSSWLSVGGWSLWKRPPSISSAGLVGDRIMNAAILPLSTGMTSYWPGIRGGLSSSFKHLLSEMITVGTTESIDVATSYFHPSRRVRRALTDAIHRDCEINILLSGKSEVAGDMPLTIDRVRALLRERKPRSPTPNLWFHGPSHLHTKLAVFDTIFSIVGSANWDFMSLNVNRELDLGILNREFAKVMRGRWSHLRGSEGKGRIGELWQNPVHNVDNHSVRWRETRGLKDWWNRCTARLISGRWEAIVERVSGRPTNWRHDRLKHLIRATERRRATISQALQSMKQQMETRTSRRRRFVDSIISWPPEMFVRRAAVDIGMEKLNSIVPPD